MIANSVRQWARGTAAAAAVWAAVLTMQPAVAQVVDSDGPDDNVFMEARTVGGKPQALFVFSDGAESGFAPKDAFSIEIDEQGGCVFDFDAPPELQNSDLKPIYGPASGRDAVGALKLPSFFSQAVAASMIEGEVVESRGMVARFFNCTGLAWALILSDPEAMRNLGQR